MYLQPSHTVHSPLLFQAFKLFDEERSGKISVKVCVLRACCFTHIVVSSTRASLSTCLLVHLPEHAPCST